MKINRTYLTLNDDRSLKNKTTLTCATMNRKEVQKKVAAINTMTMRTIGLALKASTITVQLSIGVIVILRDECTSKTPTNNHEYINSIVLILSQ